MRNTLWPEPDHEMEIDAGHPALDFTNTASRPDVDAAFAHEHLRSYGDLLRFAGLAGLLSPADRRRLEREAERAPGRAEGVLRRARALREAAFRALGAIAAGHEPPATDLDRLSEERAEAESHARLVARGATPSWDWADRGHPLERPLWPLARAAAELLASDRRADVRECAAGDCAWLFLDESRNRSRRWCSMKSCGNRAKVRRYYDRTRRTSGE